MRKRRDRTTDKAIAFEFRLQKIKPEWKPNQSYLAGSQPIGALFACSNDALLNKAKAHRGELVVPLHVIIITAAGALMMSR